MCSMQDSKGIIAVRIQDEIAARRSFQFSAAVREEN